MVTTSELNSNVDALSKVLQASQECVASLKRDGATIKSSFAMLVTDVQEIKTSLERLAVALLGGAYEENIEAEIVRQTKKT